MPEADSDELHELDALRHDLADLHLVVADIRLAEEGDLLEELAELAFRHLLGDLGGLARGLRLGDGLRALGGDDGLVETRRINRRRRGNDRSDVLADAGARVGVEGAAVEGWIVGLFDETRSDGNTFGDLVGYAVVEDGRVVGMFEDIISVGCCVE